MITFKSVTLKNFLSYGNVPTTLILDRPGTTLVLGENLDASETGSRENGTGKTVLINALTYGLYNKPISEISLDNLINNVNKKNMIVIVEFQKGDKIYKIERARKTKAGAVGNYVKIFEDDKEITPDSVNNANELIDKIIGIRYELFVRIVAFSATHIPFLDLPVRSHYAANQTDIIEELFDLKTLSEKANLLKEKTKVTEQELKSHLALSEALEREHGRHKKQIETATARVETWEKDNQVQIDHLSEKIKNLLTLDVEEEMKRHVLCEELSKNIDERKVKIKELERDLEESKKILISKDKELTHLEKDKCPYCLQKYANAASKITETKKIIDDNLKKVDKYTAKLEKLNQLQKDDQTKLTAEQKKITIDDKEEVAHNEQKIKMYQKQQQELKGRVNPFVEPLEELLDMKLEEINYDKINKLDKEIEHQKFLLKLLTKKDSFVRKALLNKNIPFLNKRLQYYLGELGLLHTVEFTHEMTASISQFGRALDFGNLSNGQRARVNLALSFAFRDVLQNMHEHINVCMLDEVLDIGLDTVGVQAAARMLKRKARDEKIAMFIISHRDEIDSAFDHRITVQMSRGFSYLKFDD